MQFSCEVAEEAASHIGVDLAAVLAREPRLRDAVILPVATIPLAARPTVELTGRVRASSARDLVLEIARREIERLRPGMLVVDRLEIVPAAAAPRRLAWPVFAHPTCFPRAWEVVRSPHLQGGSAMADTIRVVEYFYVETPNTPGVGAAMLTTLRDARVNLLAFSGFPSGRRAQIDFVPEDAAAFRAAAKAAKWKLVGPKKAFLISGDDRPGAVAELMTRLAQAKINVTAIDAVCAGSGTFGAILWVAPRDVAKAAKALGAA